MSRLSVADLLPDGPRLAIRPEPPVVIAFRVSGRPVSQGSMRAYVRGGRAVVVHDDPDKALDSWRGMIRSAAHVAMRGRPPLEGPVAVALQFALARPKRGTSGPYQWKRPDVDRLARSCLDALTGPCFADDGQVALLVADKRYSPDAWQGVAITVRELKEPA